MCSTVLLAAFASAAVTRPTVGNIRVGDVPDHTFRLPLVNGAWVKSLASLRGRPTLIEFWGTR
jgi:hypothetical protein